MFFWVIYNFSKWSPFSLKFCISELNQKTKQNKIQLWKISGKCFRYRHARKGAEKAFLPLLLLGFYLFKHCYFLGNFCWMPENWQVYKHQFSKMHLIPHLFRKPFRCVEIPILFQYMFFFFKYLYLHTSLNKDWLLHWVSRVTCTLFSL